MANAISLQTLWGDILSYNTILASIFFLIILFVVGKILAGPIKAFFKIVYSCVVSTAGLFVFNLVGGILSLHIGLNIVTVLVVGMLGIPGLALILLLQTIL